MASPFEAWAGTTPADLFPALQSCVDALAKLYASAKLAHWNVHGPLRIPLHALFGQVADAAAEHTDTLAERIVQLGDLVVPTPIDPAPTADPEGLAVAASLSELIDETEAALLAAQAAIVEDLASLDAVTDAVRAIQKLGADVRAHGL